MSNSPLPVRRLLAGVAIAGLTVLGMAAPAFAHVEAEGDQASDGMASVTFSFTHGCAGSPTTSLKIQLPAGTYDVQATEAMPGFTAQVTPTELDWTGGSVPDNTKGTFTATMMIPGTKGDTVFFPTVQGCATGEETWIEKTDDAEAELAAPRIVLTETVAASSSSTAAGGSGSSTTSKASASPSTTEAASSSSDSDSNKTVYIVGGIALVVIVVVGIVLVVRRRSSAV